MSTGDHNRNLEITNLYFNRLKPLKKHILDRPAMLTGHFMKFIVIEFELWRITIQCKN